MSRYIGDYGAGDVIDFKFTTFRPSTGASFTLAGTPVVSVYKDNSTTQSTTGVALTVDFDAVTGLNHVRITTANDATFYADGSQFECVITTGTVDSVSVVGSCIGRFTLRDQACLYPTVAGRKLDVSATGEAGLDWANVGSPTTTVGLTGTTVATSQVVASVTGAVGSVASGGITSSSFATDSITATAIAADAITSAELSSSAVQEIADGVLSRKLTMSGSISDVAVTSISSATFTGNNTYVAGDTVQFVTTAPTSFTVGTKYYVISTSLTSTTFQLSASLGGSAITTVSTGAYTVYPIDDRTVRGALRYLRNKVGISGSTMTVSTEDDTTSSWTATLTTSPGVDPVTTFDPA
jgi:hypothetical protein